MLQLTRCIWINRWYMGTLRVTLLLARLLVVLLIKMLVLLLLLLCQILLRILHQLLHFYNSPQHLQQLQNCTLNTFQRWTLATSFNGRFWLNYAHYELSQGVHGGTLGWGTVLQVTRLCSTVDGVIGIFHWLNPSSQTTALRSPQPLKEMSTSNITFMCQLSRNPESLNVLEPYGPVQTCTGIASQKLSQIKNKIHICRWCT